MRVYLVHHGNAVRADVDSQRPLSALGLRQAEWVATQAKAAGFTPAVIWHSGKRRARETAEAFLRICSPFAEFKMVRGLRPDDPPEWMRDELAGESRDLVVAGHMPHLSGLAMLLSPDARDFPLNGAMVFERKDDRTWSFSSAVVPPEP